MSMKIVVPTPECTIISTILMSRANVSMRQPDSRLNESIASMLITSSTAPEPMAAFIREMPCFSLR